MWDDELERLTNYVTDLFGEEAFNAAVARAVASVKARGSDPATEPDLVHDALREELRRMVSPPE
jgi:hypothetical protein